MYSRALLSLVCLALVLGSGPRTLDALTEKGSLLNALPAETTLLLRAGNMKSLLEKLRKSPLYRLKDRPEVQGLAKRFTDEFNLEVAEEIGFDPLQLFSDIDGEWVLAVGSLDRLATAIGDALGDGQQPDIQPDSIPFLMAADAGESVDAVHEKLEKCCAYAEKKGAKREDRRFQGGRIVHLTLEGRSPDRAASKKSDGLSLYFGELRSRVYFSLHRPFLEGVMRRGALGKTDSPGGDSLAASGRFQESLQMTGDGDALAYVDVKSLTSSVGKALSTTMFAFLWRGFDKLVLGKSFNNVAWSLSLEPQGIRHTFFANNSGASDGILALFKEDSQTAMPPKAVPRGAEIYTTTAFNPKHLGRIITEILQALRAFQGQREQMQRANVDQTVEDAVGVTLTTIVSALGNRVVLFGGKPEFGNPLAGHTCLVAVEDEAPIKKVLEKVAEIPIFNLRSEKSNARNVYLLDVGELGELAIAVAGGNLIVTASKVELAQLMDRQSGSDAGLAGAESFKNVVGVVPPLVSFASYTAPTYMKSYMDSVVAALESIGASEEGVAESLAALGRVLGSSVSHGDWNGLGLRGEGWLYYREGIVNSEQ
jgi:hypothetical protein